MITTIRYQSPEGVVRHERPAPADGFYQASPATVFIDGIMYSTFGSVVTGDEPHVLQIEVRSLPEMYSKSLTRPET